MKNNYKLLIAFIMVPLFLGAFVGFLTRGDMNVDTILPRWIFPLVWSILYILMGISAYLVYQKENKILKVYLVMLLVNYSWVFIFFTFMEYGLAFITVIVLIVLVIKMIKEYYDILPLAGYLQIPYLLWLIVALFLNWQFII